MTEGKQTLHLWGSADRATAAKACHAAPKGWTCTLAPPKRSLPQNDRLHAMLTDILRSKYEHYGRKMDMDDLKTLFVSAWQLETGRGSYIVRGLDGDGLVQLRRPTSKMKVDELGELMTIVERFCAERGITLREPKRCAS